MPSYYINTYRPLAFSKEGRQSSVGLLIPPFVDGSIRREPDFEHKMPGISCLCRGKNFAPRLNIADVVAYLTKKAKYVGMEKHQRLTAVLIVRKALQTHQEAAEWYGRCGLGLPNNCCVTGNPAKALAESHGCHRIRDCNGELTTHQEWDSRYQARAQKHGVFVVCEPLFCCLSWDSPIVEEHHFLTAFGRVPGSRNPGSLPRSQFFTFLGQFGVHVPPSSP